MLKTNRLIPTVAVALSALLGVAEAAYAECVSKDKVTEVRTLGGARTRFSPKPATTLDELKSQFVTYRADLEKVLSEAGWSGSADDLFAAVANAQPGDGVVEAREVRPGEAFPWMAFRKGSKPTCVQNLRWAGKESFPAWQIKFESGDSIYTFVVPQVCLNLTYAGSVPAPRPEPPTCSLTAKQESCEPRRVALSASGSYQSIRLTEVSTPSGPGDAAGVPSPGAGSWVYSPSGDGSYGFTAEVTSAEGLTGTCTARIDVTCPDPVCRLDGSYDPETGRIDLSSAGSQGDTDITGFTLPDGSAGSVGALIPGDGGWSYDTSATLPRRAGTYTYTFSAETTLSGETDSCDASVTVEVPRMSGWIVRGWGGPIDAKGDSVQTLGFRDSNNFNNEHRTFSLGSGSGYGLDVEYRINRRIGVDFGVLLGDLDAQFMFDLDDQWETDDGDVGITMPFVGLNFHLTPDHRVDLWAGPFVGFLSYDDESFTAIGVTIRRDFDSETNVGLAVGIDVPFQKDGSWAFTAAARYMQATADDPGSATRLDVDPLIATAGIAYRF
ncbi:MAG: hypothetical protein R3325_09455 [Thermoanaerobaculia bacterium]|nr:hypothetical protein [Thermoanaerobaculia bacterium]